MRGRAGANAEEAKVDLTPMLDVVFILLIFFIVTSTFIQEEALNAEPPPPSGGDGEPAPAILIFIDQNDEIFINRKFTDISGVRSNMERLRAENPDSSLIIQAHPLAQVGTIVQIRDQAYNAEMERVNIVRSGG